jgi:hypothetical protein
LEGKTYQWKNGTSLNEEDSRGQKVIGFIAQQVQRVLPEAVCEGDDGYLAVNYESIIPILIEAMNQHLREYKLDKMDLQEQLDELRNLSDKTGIQAEMTQHLVKYLQDLMKSNKPIGASDKVYTPTTKNWKQIFYNKKFHTIGAIISALFILVGLVLLIFNNVVNSPDLGKFKVTY